MGTRRYRYRDFDIDVGATESSIGGIWIGRYDILLMNFGVASACLSGPHTSKQDGEDDALRTATEFVDVIIGSRR